jgi:hypothetical protein
LRTRRADVRGSHPPGCRAGRNTAITPVQRAELCPCGRDQRVRARSARTQPDQPLVSSSVPARHRAELVLRVAGVEQARTDHRGPLPADQPRLHDAATRGDRAGGIGGRHARRSPEGTVSEIANWRHRPRPHVRSPRRLSRTSGFGKPGAAHDLGRFRKRTAAAGSAARRHAVPCRAARA